MRAGQDRGQLIIPLIIACALGLLLAGLGSFALVSSGTAVPSSPVDKPLITYDSR
jgi:hypothetical protein